MRRVKKKITDYENQDSYFITAFNHWVEMNLSADFTEFVQECSGYVGSLPMIFHHQKDIFSLLYAHIDKKDSNSLESLLE